MTGKELRAAIRSTGWSVSDMAAACGMSQQNLSAMFLTADVKTGIIEKISSVSGVPVSVLMGECVAPVPVRVVNNSAKIGNVGEGANVAQGNGAHVTTDCKTIERLVDELSALRRQNESLMEFITTYIKNAHA